MENLTTSSQQLQNILAAAENRPFENKEIQETIYKSLEVLRNSEPRPEIQLLQKAMAKTLDNLLRLDYVSAAGFFQMYFEALPFFKTGKKAFEAVNDNYLQAFGEKKYKDFEAFRSAGGLS